jgi:hypothetical protein
MLDHQTVSAFVMAVMDVMATKKPKKKQKNATLLCQRRRTAILLLFPFWAVCSHVHANHATTDGITCLPLPANR